MRPLARSTWLLVVAVLVAVTWVGCSGPGAPLVPGDLAALNALAEDHLTALAFLQQWLPMLDPGPPPTGTCGPNIAFLPPEPGDPPGSWRYRITLSTCTVITGFSAADGSGWEVAVDTAGRERRIDWSAPVPGNPFWTQQVDQTFYDGARMTYEIGDHPTSPDLDHYKRGTLTLAGGATMQFDHDRNIHRDILTLTPGDGSLLNIEVPLGGVANQNFRPVYVTPAEGTYTSPSQAQIALTLTGPQGAGWEVVEVEAQDGTVGQFSLDDDLAGSGDFTKGADLLGIFRWDERAEGTLDPVGSASNATGPSAAARDFALDQWIKHASDLGPSPVY